MSTLKSLKSRKLIVAAIAAVGMIVNDLFGRPIAYDAMFAIFGLVGTYILGQGIADAGAAKAAITSGVDVADAVADAIDGASRR